MCISEGRHSMRLLQETPQDEPTYVKMRCQQRELRAGAWSRQTASPYLPLWSGLHGAKCTGSIAKTALTASALAPVKLLTWGGVAARQLLL